MMARFRFIISLLAAGGLIFGLLSLTGCGGDHKELRKYIRKTKQRPSTPIEPLPKFKPHPVHKYESGHLRSPFKKTVINPNLSYQPDLDRPKEPLESYSLDALKLVGELRKQNTTWGLIETPGGKVVPVKIGNYIGQNYGQITEITPSEIKLMETVQGASGWEKRPASLVLSK